MAEIVRTDDEFSVVAHALRLSFHWDGHRWRHEIRVGGRVVASSLEWEPGRDDPTRVVSPAYQQLSAHRDETGAGALLVGQWGPHHGSAVFLVRERPTGVVVEADVAVRSRGPLIALAGTYLVPLTSSALVTADPLAVVWDLDPPPAGRLRFEPAGGDQSSTRVGLAEAGRAATRVQAVADLVPTSASQRLRYQWSWQPHAVDNGTGPERESSRPARS